MKMSEVFDLPVSAGEKAASRASAILDGCGTFGIINDKAMEHSRHAINNHDRLVEENAELREVLIMMLDSPDAICMPENKTVREVALRLLNKTENTSND